MYRPDVPSVQTNGCDCDNCRNGDLPINPFLAPRVEHGMLLGKDDFATLIGYPRGKHMLHQAWLHGTGVLWGFGVRRVGLWGLEVCPGLCIDCIGRELILTGCRNLDLRELRDKAIKDGKLDGDENGKSNKAGKKSDKAGKESDEAGKPAQASSEDETVTIQACVVAEFEGCRTAPVPTLADPCDVNRTYDEYSRVIEQAHIDVRYGPCPKQPVGEYHRVRVLLGLDKVGDPDEPGREALQAREAVLKATDRAQELEHQLREMACRDGIDVHPTREDDHAYGWFRCAEEDAAVVLAEVDITLQRRDDNWEFAKEPVVRECVRTTLLPTDVITSLTAGLAPGLLSWPGAAQQGPQVHASLLRLEDDRKKLIIPVSAGLVRGTVPGSVDITTLAREDGDRWVVEDIYDTSYDAIEKAIVVRLAYSLNERPATALVRVRVRGTGSKPVMGEDPLLPLAGVHGRTPSHAQEGLDAVWTFTNDLGRAKDAGEPTQSTAADQAELTPKEAK
jgi:hypothetical protein